MNKSLKKALDAASKGIDPGVLAAISSLSEAGPTIASHRDLSDLERIDYSMADWQYEKIMERIAEFEQDLDEDHEVAIRLAYFGRDIILSVSDIGYNNPSLIVFYGYVGTESATLIQHVNQLNFLLLAQKKPDPATPPRRIGFFSVEPDQSESGAS